jgi:hypothetical protein
MSLWLFSILYFKEIAKSISFLLTSGVQKSTILSKEINMTIDQLNVENAKKMGFEEKIIYGMIIGYEHCVEVRGLKFGKSVCLVSFIDTQHKDNIQFTISIY